MTTLKELRCRACGASQKADRSFCCSRCFGPLEPVYDYDSIAEQVSPERIQSRPNNLWRYRELLPISGEPRSGFNSGFTPLVHARELGKRLGLKKLYIKDDSVNHPSLSYKDRVVSVAITRGLELGYRVFACASTGNLANSVAAQCAAQGLPSLLFVPRSIEPSKLVGSLVFGATLIALDGNYDQVNRLCAEIGDEYGWGFVNVNLRPYYTEGAKTMGYEIAEQLGWRLPDHLVLPTAGGSLLPRVAKAFRELRTLGWAKGKGRFYSAQASGCAPVVRAFQNNEEWITPEKPNTIAHSIAIGDPADGPLVLHELRQSGGGAEKVNDSEIVRAIRLLAESEGIFTEPAGGTTLAVALKLLDQGRFRNDDVVVIGITGNGYKTIDLLTDTLTVDTVLKPNLEVFRQWYASSSAARPENPVAGLLDNVPAEELT